ncbi:MAG: hypothetical protein Q4C47_02000, partial [Planctomycetia bacterium]|nr:hypothetical protein [Planctomycetia bacterium]
MTLTEQAGIFLNYVNGANIRYGGGEVRVNGVRSGYAAIHLNESRLTITNNTFWRNATAAISADPDSFAESQFESVGHVADYTRVGPHIRGNTVTENTINGVLVRVDVVDTAAGREKESLSVTARFDDNDITHVLSDVLVLEGSAGGLVRTIATNRLTCDADNNRLWAVAGTTVQGGSISGITDGEYFTISDGVRTVVFEFDNNGRRSITGSVLVSFASSSTREQVRDSLLASIDQAVTTYGISVEASSVESGSGATRQYGVQLSSPSGAILSYTGFGGYQTRSSGQLVVDPGVVMKMLDGARFELGMGAQLIAEGTDAYPVIMTSVYDDRYGVGGTPDATSNGSVATAQAGDWLGIYSFPTSTLSLDHVVFAYAGGAESPSAGVYRSFNPIEVYQATARITHTRFEYNQAVDSTADRAGTEYGTTTGDNGQSDSDTYRNNGVVYVRGSQPVISENLFVNNDGAAISIDVNSLTSDTLNDWGRSTSQYGYDRLSGYDGNTGPLVRGNVFGDSVGDQVNGMVVRADGLVVSGTWDDADITHVVYDEITIANYHHVGGLRLQSSETSSLVVKFLGENAGITATGSTQEIDDRVGGTLQVIGQAGKPVVMTSLYDDSVGAGYNLQGRPVLETVTSNAAAGAGDWRGLQLLEYSNDRNVQVVVEYEASSSPVSSDNSVSEAQNIGSLASTIQGGDENLRLGFDIYGTIRYDQPQDADVY